MEDLIKAVEATQMKKDMPQVEVGDRVRVHLRIREGQRERIQVFEGYVIARKGKGVSETITVRRVSYGVGVERVFLLHSPLVEKIERVHPGVVRRAKLYYLRERTGRASRIRERLVQKRIDEGEEINMDEIEAEVEAAAAAEADEATASVESEEA